MEPDTLEHVRAIVRSLGQPAPGEDKPSLTCLAERHLEDLVAQDPTSIGLRGWVVYGRQVKCGQSGHIGVIDLLLQEPDKNEWIVVELKRDLATDQVVGQVLRYVAFTRAHFARGTGRVRGLIVCGAVDAKLAYALSALDGLVECLVYRVQLQLQNVQLISEFHGDAAITTEPL